MSLLVHLAPHHKTQPHLDGEALKVFQPHARTPESEKNGQVIIKLVARHIQPIFPLKKLYKLVHRLPDEKAYTNIKIMNKLKSMN